MNRSEFIAGTVGGLGAFLTSGGPGTTSGPGSVKFLFLNDLHLPAVPPAHQYQQILKALKEQHADFIINGGDVIYDACKTSREEIDRQWLSWQAFRKSMTLPLYSCIGNHDIDAWELPDYHATNPDEQKQRAIAETGMPGRYYRFRQKNWHFILLDSMQYVPGGYEGRIDTAQIQWLQASLKEIPPDDYILIISHIPLLSACYRLYLDGGSAQTFSRIEGRLIHRDSWEITSLLSRFSNVKACLSGHLHMQEHIHYKGVDYFCCGAASGNLWKGPFNGFAPAFHYVELGKDGTVRLTRHEY